MTLLEIQNLTVAFPYDQELVPVITDVSLQLEEGQSLGLVGESGCGKTVTAMSILRLLASPPAVIQSGTIRFDGKNLLSLPIDQLRAMRGREISMIFQEPMTALSPLYRIGDLMIELFRYHRKVSKKAAREISIDWLQRVGIPDPADRMSAYPHQLSGGMRQRVMIAMALMHEPRLVIADEPTTALDVTIQAQILDLMRNQVQKKASLLLITHDMGVIREMCSHVAVMYAGEIIETGTVNEVFNNPLHPYTSALLAAIPGINPECKRLPVIPGHVPPPSQFAQGCRFHPRCDKAFAPCATQHPAQTVLYNRRVACHLWDQKYKSANES